MQDDYTKLTYERAIDSFDSGKIKEEIVPIQISDKEIVFNNVYFIFSLK